MSHEVGAGTILATSNRAIYNITSGKNFFTRKIIIGNSGASSADVEIYDGVGTNFITGITVPANNTVELNSIIGMEFQRGTVLAKITRVVGTTTLWIGGEEL